MATLNDFVLTEAYIRTDRTMSVNGVDTNEIDITNFVAEFIIYENIDVPFLTGSVTFVDTASITDTVNLQGDEHISLSWSVNNKAYSKEFVVTEIRYSSKGDDHSALIGISIMEPHGALSYLKVLNSYRHGKITDIVKSVLRSELFLELEVDDENFETDSNNPVQVMDRGRSPLAICKQLVDTATNSDYEPMYLYSTMYSGMMLKSLEGMEDVEDKPTFIYGPYIAHNNDYTSDFRDRSKHIKHYQEDDGASYLKRGKMRGVSHEQIVVDPLTGHIETSHTTYEDSVKNGRTPDIDTEFTIRGKRIIDTPITKSVEIIPTRTFGDRTGNIENVHEETVQGAHSRKTTRHILDQMLRQRVKTIVVLPFFFENKQTVGKSIDIVVPKNRANITTGDNEIDLQKSGKHVIISSKHVFSPLNNSYNITLRISKLDAGH